MNNIIQCIFNHCYNFDSVDHYNKYDILKYTEEKKWYVNKKTHILTKLTYNEYNKYNYIYLPVIIGDENIVKDSELYYRSGIIIKKVYLFDITDMRVFLSIDEKNKHCNLRPHII